MRLQAIASVLQNFPKISLRTLEEKTALAKRVPGTVRTSDTLLHSGLYPRLILPSNISTDVTTPRTKPQMIFERNMDTPIDRRLKCAGDSNETTKLRLGVGPHLRLGRRENYAFQIKPRNDTKQDCM
jgi:hypothetical protein